MKKLWQWLINNSLLLGAISILFFVPLYPKLPLINVIRTWVYIRLEDFLAAIVIGLLLLIVWRKRKEIESPLLIPILVYWCVGLVSLVWSIIFIGPHLSNYFPHLVVLHYLRRIEYMSMFFVAYIALSRNKKALPWIIGIMAVTSILIIIYGLGQKIYGFPAFLTMNEEFAKGIPLRLPPTARITSTFGGHYDLAAFIVLFIPVFGSLAIGLKNIIGKIFFFLLVLGCLVLLLLTASRVSFGVYLVAMCVMVLWHRKPLYLIPTILISIVMLNLVSGTAQRFYKTLRFDNVVVDLSTGKPVGTLDKFEGTNAVIGKSENPGEEALPKGSAFINVPDASADKNSAKSVKTIEILATKEFATGSGEVATISGSFLIQKALVYDISITTRFQGQWPKAMEAFQRNILLGSGYSTLSLAADGDYHRMLGETGLLGAISFLGILAFGFYHFSKKKDTLTPLSKAFVIGVFAGITGLLLNGILIDVFEASKVAFMVWLLLGFAFATISVKESLMPYQKFLWRVFTHPFATVVYILLALVFVYVGVLTVYFIGDDFTWLRWAAQSHVSDILQYFSSAQGFFYRPIPKIWNFVLFSLFWLKPYAYHVMSLVLFGISVIAVYTIMLKANIKRYIAVIITFMFIALSIHHENIYWISGQSSLLSAAFLFTSIVQFQHVWKNTKFSVVRYLVALLLLFGAMLSYDGMIIAPAIVSLLGFSIYRQRKSALIPLFLIALYLVLRMQSGAINAAGDYAYNIRALPVNIFANVFGYMLSILFGPRVIELFAAYRLSVKMYIVPITIFIGFMSLLLTIVLIRLRSYGKKVFIPGIWFICFILSLTPYLGLGNMAERYAFIASAFFLITCGLLINQLFISSKYLPIKAIIFLSILGLFYWNVQEVRRIDSDWQIASKVSEQTLLKMKKEFFPLAKPTTFLFVNLPIHYGRAWIFPTGMQDALWHMFRESPYATVNVSSVAEALDYKPRIGESEIITFQDFGMKRLVREVKIVDDKSNEK